MKKFTFSILFALISFCGFSQIDLAEAFDDGLVLPTDWTSESGDYFGSVVAVCQGFSPRSNFFDGNTTGHLTSPNQGVSNGTDLTISFDYKIVDWSAAVDATPPGWGEMLVQYSTNDGTDWITVETINDVNHITSNECFNFSTVLPAADLPVGSNFKLRIDTNWLAGTYYVYIDNVIARQEVEGPPSCVNLITPVNGSTGVSISTNLEWSAATNIPAGYTLSVGTTSGATDVVDNEDVGISTSFNFDNPLEYSTTYFVTVSAYNDNGPAVDCDEFSFTTGADPNAPVDCESGAPINVVYCYDNNETITWNFQSSTGGPLNVFFNAGQFETCCDDIIIYDGTDNTGVVLFSDGLADMNSVSVNSTSGFIFIEIQSDGSVSCASNGYTPLDFDVSCIDETAVPNCNSALVTPENGAVDVNENTDITWSAASVIVDGYFLSIGTTPGGTDILDNFDNGPATTYDPGTLDYETTYYVTVVPYNTNGNAENCVEQSFTTRDDPNQILDCDNNEEVNTTYCYTANDTMVFNYASNNGNTLAVFFNSGWIEAGWDELIVTDSDGTVIFQGDNGGDLTGLSFVSSGGSISIAVDSDGVGQCDGSDNAQWDFTVSCVDETALPNCNAVLTGAVANGTTDVNENEDLTWSAASVFVTGYVLNVGTTPGGTDVLDGVDVGDVLTYDLGTMAYETTHYVTIIPYNDNGSADTGCIEESFTTKADPNQIVDCASGEVINTTFCYENGDNTFNDVFSFQSSDGSPLAISFNAGNMEAGFDTIRITDSDGSIIFEGDGELTGLSFFTTGDSLTVWYEADGSVSCSSGSRPEWDFDVACFDPTAVPNCNATVSAPADGEVDVNIDADLTWSPASIVVTGYIINMGTTPGGTDVLDGVDVGDVLTYDPGTLDNATDYYVTVIPYNDNGNADADCVESTFKTVCLPQIVTFNAVGDCETDPNNPAFVLEVNVVDLSGADSIIISDDQGSATQTANEVGVITMGPYDANTVVTITTIKSDDDTCDVISSPITFICPPPPNQCSIVYAGEDAAVDCDENNSTDLSAVYHLFGQDTNNYVINGLDACPLPATVGGTPTSLNIDDRWSEVINLGFEFCFFDEVYSQILIGSNGVLSFELENAGTGNGWAMDPDDTLPNNTNPTLGEGNIFGVGHDIDPSVTGDINYLVIGSAPYRMFVVNYVDVAHFSGACNTTLFSSSQIILYESSNNIDVNVFEKPICDSWNDGLAVIGVQNIAGDVGFSPAGRNTGVWEVTTDAPESYRFAPFDATPSFVFEWFDGATSLGNSETITVSPTETTTYTASVTYDLCTGGTATVTDEVTVTVSGSGGEASFTMEATCDGATATITGDEGGTFSFDPEPTDDAEIDADTGEITNGTPGETYTVVYTISGECGSTATESVTLLPAEDSSFTLEATCDGATVTITGDAGGTFAFNPEPGDDAMINSEDGTITNGSPGATYTVEYTTSGDCASSSTQDVTVLDAEDSSFTLEATCDGATATVTGDAGGTFAFNPEPGDGAVIGADGTITNGSPGATYTVEYTTSGDCVSSSTQDVTVLDAEDASFILESTCTEVTATITGDVGGTFAFNPEPGDGATIDSNGTISNGVLGNTYTVEYTTSGDCTASSTQTITLEDSVPPVAIAQDITVELDADGNATISVDDINNGSTDDCGIASVSIDIESFTCDNVGDNAVTLTVTDVAGNVSSATATVTVEDNTMPDVVCNNITISLDSTGGYTLSQEDMDAIASGTSDACGIGSMSVSNDTFSCDEIGDNTITLTVVDVNGNENSCEATVTVEGVVPDLSISEEDLSIFCPGVILTAESDVAVTYEWSTGEDTQSITVLENGTYGVTVTSESGCTAYAEYLVSGISDGASIADYTIYASNEVFLHGNNSVQSGGVGVGSANGEIKLHQDSHIEGFGQATTFTLNQGSTIGEEINETANPELPGFVYNTLSGRDSESVTIASGNTQTLDGEVYDLIWVRSGATVIFSQSNVFVNRIKTSEGANIEFEGCSNVYVNDMFQLHNYGTINSNGNPVSFYVNNDIHIEKGSNVNAIMYSTGQILAKGSNVNSNNPEPTYMTGLFIANKVHGLNNVIWNAADICDTCPVYDDLSPQNRESDFDVVSWPNPTNTIFNMRLNTLDVENDAVVFVYDMNNKLVHTATFGPDQKHSFGSELGGGIYIVKVQQAKNTKVIRVVKY